MPKKQPYLPLYTGDWKKDPKLSRCTPATRGVWIDLLCAMHDEGCLGELRGTAEDLARLARCLTAELVQALTDLQTTGAADVSERNGVWHVCNRRMRADAEKRKRNADRQMRHRLSSSNGARNAPITPIEVDIENDFELFWEEYPPGRKRSKGTAREAFLKAISKADAATIIAAAKDYAASEVGRGQYVKMPATWLNQECWNDDRESWRDREGVQAPRQNEYKRIPREDFAAYIKSGEFLTGPYKDKPDATGYVRAFGTLKNGRKVESNNDPDWKP